MRLPTAAALLAVLTVLLVAAPAQAGGAPSQDQLLRDLKGLVATDGGPPGAVMTLRRGGDIETYTAGRADVATGRRPRAGDHMRLASVAKAFSGAVALRLVAEGELELGTRIGQVLPRLPRAWSAVRLRQLLNHTSGLPDYTESDGFRRQFEEDPQGYVSPARILSWVEDDPLNFSSGSRYRYSNTDNIVVGLMAERVTGRAYGRLLRDFVFRPLDLTETSFPRTTRLPRPFIHGYLTAPGERPEDVSTALNPSGAWASGAIVSTPLELGTFIRGYLGARLFPARLQRRQLRFVAGGRSSPPGPGRNSAGLAVFRYRTRCGTVYGHTGNFPGYVQFAAATRNGRRAVTTSLNIPAPSGALLRRLRAMQAAAVCRLLSLDPRS
jgi:D-alanyl-D-alanine carboxypeptidase